MNGPDNPANLSNGSTTFLVLETIFEENSDELDTSDTESVASSTEESSSCSSDDEDVASVIHISPDLSCEDSESERDVEVPKKRRKRELNPFRPRLASEDDDQQSSLSRSSSLLQFETLEKAIMEENSIVFKTSATEKPFVTDSSPPSFSSFSFDSLEHRPDSPIKDSLEDTSSDEESSYFLDRNKLNLRQSRLRSYRSFDSLLHVVRPQKFSNLDEENDIVPELKQSTNIQSLMHTLKSSENLSEDSGFGGDSENKKSPVKETIFDQFDLKSPIKETIFEENFSEEDEFVRFNDQLEEFETSPKEIVRIHDRSSMCWGGGDTASGVNINIISVKAKYSLPTITARIRVSTAESRQYQRKKKSSQENLTIEDEAINSVEQAAAELSNLDQLDRKKTTDTRKKITDDRKDDSKITGDRKKIADSPPPLPTSGPPKSRLLGIVGRKKPVAQAQSATATPVPQQFSASTPSEESFNQKIDVTPVSSPATTGKNNESTKKASSLVNLGMMNVVDIDINHDYGETNGKDSNTLNCSSAAAEARAKSMEFLLDEENKAAIL
ncbi:hypothetical protein B566_EDAN011183, partial [Ephemera danica]